MELTYYGHSCFSVKIGGKNILFDPFVTPNPNAAHIDINDIKADYVLLSHGHFDHVADALSIAKNNDALIVSNYEIVSWFAEKNDYKKGHPLNHGGAKAFDFGTVKYVNAVHSSVLPDGAYGGNAGGFVISSKDGDFYFAGDTALTMDMKLIPLFNKLRFAVLPVGDNFTMGIAEAVIASEFIECDTIIGVHYDTFGYIVIDHSAAIDAFAAKGKRLLLPKIGETIDI